MKSKKKSTVGRAPIILLRPGITDPIEAIKKKKRSLLVLHEPTSNDPKRWCFSSATDRRPPPWTSLFNGQVEDPVIVEPSTAHSALIFFRVSGRIFVLTFGHGAASFLDPDAIEPTFGYDVANRILDPNTITHTESFTPESNTMRAKHQSTRGVSLDQFGHNRLRDNLNVLAGVAVDEKFGKRLQGTKALVAAQAMTFDLVVERCRHYLEVFENKGGKYASLYNNMLEDVHDGGLVDKLTYLFMAKLRILEVDDIVVGVPFFYDFEEVEGFRFSVGKGDFTFDLSLRFYLEHGRHSAGITVEILKSDMIESKSTDDGTAHARWSVWECLEAEIRYGGNIYLLLGGRWRKLPPSVLGQIDVEIDRVPTAAFKLPVAAAGDSEGKYNEFAARISGFTLFDRNIFKWPGFTSGIEFCDLCAVVQGACIHVKRGTSSSDLSHLFRQAVNSAKMFLSESELQTRVRVELRKSHDDFTVEKFMTRRDLTVVFAIVTHKIGKWSEILPTFSKISLYDALRDLRTTPFKAQLMRIEQKAGASVKTITRKKSPAKVS